MSHLLIEIESKGLAIKCLQRFIKRKEEKIEKIKELKEKMKEIEIEIETIENTEHSINRAIIESIMTKQKDNDKKDWYRKKMMLHDRAIGKGKHKSNGIIILENEGNEYGPGPIKTVHYKIK